MNLNIKNKIYSPCITICTLDDNDKYCLGCGRTVKEIQDWMFLSDEEKKEIIKQIPGRKKKNTT